MGCNGIKEDNDGNGLIIEAWDYSYPMAVYILFQPIGMIKGINGIQPAGRMKVSLHNNNGGEKPFADPNTSLEGTSIKL